MTDHSVARFGDQELVRFICAQLSLDFPDHENFVRELAISIRQRCGHPIFPETGETLAVSVTRPKTAALAFDRVYRIPVLSDLVPAEIGFFGGTATEFAFCAFPLISWSATEAGIQVELPNPAPPDAAVNEQQTLALFSSNLQATFRSEPTIFYSNRSTQAIDYPTGPREVLATAISDLELVDESSLSWEQVLEFRRDPDARRKYRRLIRWLDTELQTKTPTELVATMENRLDEYQWALRKHGLNTVLGAISCLLDPKFLGGLSATVAGAAVAGGTGWAAIAGASLAVGRSLVSVGTTYIAGLDERRKGEREIAYVHEIQKRL